MPHFVVTVSSSFLATSKRLLPVTGYVFLILEPFSIKALARAAVDGETQVDHHFDARF